MSSTKFEGVVYGVSCHDKCVWVDACVNDALRAQTHANVHARFKLPPDGPYWDIRAAGSPRDVHILLSPSLSERDATRAAWERFAEKLQELIGIDVRSVGYPGDQPEEDYPDEAAGTA